eukprot:m.461385 g.461385  ORF g.461385 m.461385 type:complete len:151 (-) comp57015_c1_seq80:2209-2661(-)
MQAMHCAFGIGAFIAPLVAEPFLIEQPDSDDDYAIRNLDADQVDVAWAYRIAGITVLTIGLPFVYWILRPVPPMLDPHSSSSSFSSRAQGSARYPIICLAFLLLFLSCGVEVSYGGYVLTYAVKVGFVCLFVGWFDSPPIRANFSDIAIK